MTDSSCPIANDPSEYPDHSPTGRSRPVSGVGSSNVTGEANPNRRSAASNPADPSRPATRAAPMLLDRTSTSASGTTPFARPSRTGRPATTAVPGPQSISSAVKTTPASNAAATTSGFTTDPGSNVARKAWWKPASRTPTGSFASYEGRDATASRSPVCGSMTIAAAHAGDHSSISSCTRRDATVCIRASIVSRTASPCRGGRETSVSVDSLRPRASTTVRRSPGDPSMRPANRSSTPPRASPSMPRSPRT